MDVFNFYNFSTAQWVSIGVIIFVFITMIIFGATRAGDLFFHMTNHWKTSVAAFLLIALTLLFTVFHQPVVKQIRSMYWMMVLNEGHDVLTRVEDCRAFLTAIQNGQEYIPDTGHSGGLHNYQPEQYWDICSDTFGKNYWKHDISVNGQHGGHVLCALYNAQSDIISSKAKVWCDTVFKKK